MDPGVDGHCVCCWVPAVNFCLDLWHEKLIKNILQDPRRKQGSPLLHEIYHAITVFGRPSTERGKKQSHSMTQHLRKTGVTCYKCYVCHIDLFHGAIIISRIYIWFVKEIMHQLFMISKSDYNASEWLCHRLHLSFL